MTATYDIAREARQEIDTEPWVPFEEKWGGAGVEVRYHYLGTFFVLDPCGKYHHPLSCNSMSQECVDFWENLDTDLSSFGLSLEAGEGDPIDVLAAEYRDVDSSGRVIAPTVRKDQEEQGKLL
jgi:hypothetical protein